MKIKKDKLFEKFILKEKMEDMPDWLKPYLDVEGFGAAGISNNAPYATGRTLRQVLTSFYTTKDYYFDRADVLNQEIYSLFVQCKILRDSFDEVLSGPDRRYIEFDVDDETKNDYKTALSVVPQNKPSKDTDIEALEEEKIRFKTEKKALNKLAEDYNKVLINVWRNYRKADAKNKEVLRQFAVEPITWDFKVNTDNSTIKYLGNTKHLKYVKDIESELSFEDIDLNEYFSNLFGTTNEEHEKFASFIGGNFKSFNPQDVLKMNSYDKKIKFLNDKKEKTKKGTPERYEVEKEIEILRKESKDFLNAHTDLKDAFESTKDAKKIILGKFGTRIKNMVSDMMSYNSHNPYASPTTSLIAFHFEYLKGEEWNANVPVGDAVAVLDVSTGGIVYQTPIKDLDSKSGKLRVRWASDTSGTKAPKDSEDTHNAMEGIHWLQYCSDVCEIFSKGSAIKRINVDSILDDVAAEIVSTLDTDRDKTKIIDVSPHAISSQIHAEGSKLDEFVETIKSIEHSFDLFENYLTDEVFHNAIDNIIDSKPDVESDIKGYFKGLRTIVNILRLMGILKVPEIRDNNDLSEEDTFDEIMDCVDKLTNSDNNEIEDIYRSALHGNNFNNNIKLFNKYGAPRLTKELNKLNTGLDEIYNKASDVKTNNWRSM